MKDNVVKIMLLLSTIIIISVLIIKRFVYFKPTTELLPTTENYKVIKNRHLHGWLSEGKNDKIILFCHGNTGNISHSEHKTKALNSLGYSVLIFDYSGYGKSSGVPSETQCYKDASLMLSFLLETYRPHQIILYGESIGGPIATYAARRYNIPKLILESTISNIKTLITQKYNLEMIAFLFYEFNTETYLNGYTGKTLLLHSKDDEIIPFYSILHLQPYVSYFVPMSGIHNNPYIPWDKIKEFIEV